MTFRELALEFDGQERPVEAAWAYEIALRKPDARPELYLNLAVLYFQCLDFGYAAKHDLPQSFVEGAGLRSVQVLNEAVERFGQHAEVEFWRRYFALIYSGGEPFDEACKQLALASDSGVPYLYLFTSSGRRSYLEEAKSLFESVKDGSTERKRYIKSLLS